MYDVDDDAMGVIQRIEILTGPGRCRRWSTEERRESSRRRWRQEHVCLEAARRWQVCPQQVLAVPVAVAFAIPAGAVDTFEHCR